VGLLSTPVDRPTLPSSCASLPSSPAAAPRAAGGAPRAAAPRRAAPPAARPVLLQQGGPQRPGLRPGRRAPGRAGGYWGGGGGSLNPHRVKVSYFWTPLSELPTPVICTLLNETAPVGLASSIFTPPPSSASRVSIHVERSGGSITALVSTWDPLAKAAFDADRVRRGPGPDHRFEHLLPLPLGEVRPPPGPPVSTHGLKSLNPLKYPHSPSNCFGEAYMVFPQSF